MAKCIMHNAPLLQHASNTTQCIFGENRTIIAQLVVCVHITICQLLRYQCDYYSSRWMLLGVRILMNSSGWLHRQHELFRSSSLEPEVGPDVRRQPRSPSEASSKCRSRDSQRESFRASCHICSREALVVAIATRDAHAKVVMDVVVAILM